MAITMEGDYKKYNRAIGELNAEINSEINGLKDGEKLSKLYYDMKVCELVLEESKNKLEKNLLKRISDITKFIVLVSIVYFNGKSMYLHFQVTNDEGTLLHDLVVILIAMIIIVGVFFIINSFIESFYKQNTERMKLKKIVIEKIINELESVEVYNNELDKIVLEKKNLKNKEINK